ncbi:MAG: hypothetical protein ABI885_17415 [Gammaproteobacteria bacterium]
MVASPEEPRTTAPSASPHRFPFSALYDVNERCIELLVHAARSSQSVPFALVSQVREELRNLDPEARRRTASHGFLLIDLEFGNVEWWQAALAQPQRTLRAPAWRGSFERRAGISLTRSTLMFVWHSLRADRDAARVLLGLAAPVAELLRALPLPALDPIAERYFRHLRPRWHERPALWRLLLKSAAAGDPAAQHGFDVLGLQLIGGELLEDQ